MQVSSKKRLLFEDTNHFVDLERDRRRKRRCRGDSMSRVIHSQDCRYDKDYIRYLHRQRKIRGRSCEIKEEQDIDDPTYAMFLENLKEHGNSYMLDVSLEHDVIFPVKYEIEDVRLDELKNRTQNSCKIVWVQEFSSTDSESEGESFGFLKEGNLIHKKSSLSMDGKLESDVRGFSCGKGNTLIDSPKILEMKRKTSINVHKNCPGKRKHHKESYQPKSTNVCNIINDSSKGFVCGPEAITERVFYKHRKGKREYYKVGHQKKMANIQGKSLGASSSVQISSLEPLTQSSTPCKPIQIWPPNSNSAKGHCNVHFKSWETASKALIPSSRKPQTLSQPTLRAPASMATSNLRSSMVETLQNARHVIPQKKFWFYKKLETICSKPYEQKEYEDLLEQVSLRKPVIVHKDTRHREYTKTGAMGKSYLDNYPDLANEITKANSEPHKVLNLLRGFFFYLLKLPHGVPKPWRDNTCRAIMLRSTEIVLQ